MSRPTISKLPFAFETCTTFILQAMAVEISCQVSACRLGCETKWSGYTSRQHLTLWNALPLWLAGRRKGFVYWRPGLVTHLRVGSLLFLSPRANRRKKLQP